MQSGMADSDRPRFRSCPRCGRDHGPVPAARLPEPECGALPRRIRDRGGEDMIEAGATPLAILAGHLATIGATLLLVAVWIAGGSRLLGFLHAEHAEWPAPLPLVTSALLGQGLCALLVLVLGAVGLLHPPIVLGVLVLLPVLAPPPPARPRPRRRGPAAPPDPARRLRPPPGPAPPGGRAPRVGAGQDEDERR